MKIIVAADIHGSLTCCRELLKAYDSLNADRLILLGDILYHGPRNGLFEGYDPKLTAELLNGHARSIICVKGNCDSDVDQMVLDFPIMSKFAVVSLEGVTALMTHDLEVPESLPLAGIDIVFSGHTHVPDNTLKGGVLYANPGSVTLPKDGSPRGYILWEQSRLSWISLEGTTFDSAII